ncbi:MAG: prephenate dehydratase [Armatimonadota bacterium]|nr:prephenate dehydratase [Armatimonadota bacterium]
MSLLELRTQIEALDEQVLHLLNQRAGLAMEVGHVKAGLGQPPFVPGREVQVLERIQRLNVGPLPATAIRAIYQEIISSCRNLEHPVTVAYLGPAATWSHLAARQQFGETAQYEPLYSIAEVFAAVETGRQDFGLAPVENSTAGAVGDTLDALAETSLTICAEVLFQIHFSLVSKEADLSDIQRVYSLPIAAEQCRRWLNHHLPHAEIRDAPGDASSTAHAAQKAAAEPHSAAIANRAAAEAYGLESLFDRIEDTASNTTRFFVLGKNGNEPSGRDKTSLMFAVPHRPGSWNTALRGLEKNGVNLTMINSRPTKQMPWEYVFFVDVQGHAREERLAAAMAEMKLQCAFLRILGSYAEAGERG